MSARRFGYVNGLFTNVEVVVDDTPRFIVRENDRYAFYATAGSRVVLRGRGKKIFPMNLSVRSAEFPKAELSLEEVLEVWMIDLGVIPAEFQPGDSFETNLFIHPWDKQHCCPRENPVRVKFLVQIVSPEDLASLLHNVLRGDD